MSMEVDDDVVAGLTADIHEAECLLEQAKQARVKQGILALVQQLQTELMAAKVRSPPPHHGGSSTNGDHAQPEKEAAAAEEDAAATAAGASKEEGPAPMVGVIAETEAPSSTVSSSAASAATAAAAAAAEAAGLRFVPVERFAWDQGEYNSPWVTVYVELPGVGAVKEGVSCTFNKDSFDLQVEGLGGKNYRLRKDNLEHDVVASESKYIVKRDRVLLKLKKVKGEYSYEHWNELTSKKRRDRDANTKKDPSAGIMDLMKDMYESGDDNMRKIIGESMSKAYSGQKAEPPTFGSGDGGLSGMGDDFGGL